MALPESYADEATFAAYLLRQLGRIGTVLGWTTATGRLLDVVDDTLIDAGAEQITAVVGRSAIVRLRVLGRARVWEAACDELAALVNDTTGKAVSWNREALVKQAEKRAASAQREAAGYRPTGRMRAVPIRFVESVGADDDEDLG